MKRLLVPLFVMLMTGPVAAASTARKPNVLFIDLRRDPHEWNNRAGSSDVAEWKQRLNNRLSHP